MDIGYHGPTARSRRYQGWLMLTIFYFNFIVFGIGISFGIAFGIVGKVPEKRLN